MTKATWYSIFSVVDIMSTLLMGSIAIWIVVGESTHRPNDVAWWIFLPSVLLVFIMRGCMAVTKPQEGKEKDD